MLKQLGFALDAFVKGQLGGGLDGIDGGQRRDQVALLFARCFTGRGDDRSIGLFIPELAVEIARTARKCADLGSRECDRAWQKIAFDNLIDDARPGERQSR